MSIYCLRLKRGSDLRSSIEQYCLLNNLNTVTVLSSVGCIYQLNIRLAEANDTFKTVDNFEILSLNGTISNGQAHLHIAVSDNKANTYGGHLLEDTLIDTTCELVLMSIDNYTSKRTFDENTGYDEIEFIEVKDE